MKLNHKVSFWNGVIGMMFFMDLLLRLATNNFEGQKKLIQNLRHSILGISGVQKMRVLQL